MRRVVQVMGNWRPRRGTVMVGIVLAVGGAGVGWAATRATNPGVITACVSAGNPTLLYSSSGSCDPTQTTVVWNETGPQGQQGLTGAQGPPGQSAPTPVLAWGPSSYKPGFTISAIQDKAGEFVIDGSVDAALTPSSTYRKTVVATCSLLTGPPNGTATVASQWKLTFVYHRTTRSFTPSSASGPVDINTDLTLSGKAVPIEIYFTCRGFTGAVWTHPQITIEAATTSSFHRVVGAALPVKPVIGPGPIRKVLGN